MAQYGLTVADLGGKSSVAKSGKKGKTGGTKVAAKYRNASTGESWSGRGLQPRWLKAALASGRKITDFAV
jgi:DNA-binding protein H-NS